MLWKNNVANTVQIKFTGYIGSIFTALCLSCASFSTPTTTPTTTTPKQAKAQLETLNQRIDHLQGHLTHDQKERLLLTQELSTLEKKISYTLQQLTPLKHEVLRQNEGIYHLRNKIAALNKRLYAQTSLLNKHLQIFYHVERIQPVEWFVDPTMLHTATRMIVYHQHLMQARYTLIQRIQKIKASVTKQQQALTKKITYQNTLEKNLEQRQQHLEEIKQHQLVVLNKLTQAIENKRGRLKEYQQDKEKLTQLLQTLLKNSSIQNAMKFSTLRKKLSQPLTSAHTIARKMHQGLTFFAPEGTQVMAVHPGKVVFSDWLRGYGLLLILDHGQGYMTLYAHNQALLKKQGEWALGNEPIATVGHTGGLKQDGLYFEIRHRGKTLPPSHWLL